MSLLKYSFLLLALTGIISSCQKATPEKTAITKNQPMLKHIVIFKFKQGTSETLIEEVSKNFSALQNTIPQVKSFEMGANISTEGHDQGFTHCYLLEFVDKAALDIYSKHPDHLKFVETLKPILAEPFVVDFMAEK